jgi:hypothetical protein
MNLSESLRHYSNLIEAPEDQWVTKAIKKWNSNVGKADVPPPPRRDDPYLSQVAPQPYWSASDTEQWLNQFGDARLINKRSRHERYTENTLPALSVMLKEPKWGNFVRYYAILKSAYSQADRNNDQAAAAELRRELSVLQKEYVRRRDAIQQREAVMYDLEAKTKRDYPEFYKDPTKADDGGGFDWD